MSTLKMRWVGVMAVLLAACGSDALRDLHRAEAPGAAQPGGPRAEAPVAPGSTRMELRVLGVEGQADAVLLGVKDIVVTAAGRPLPVDVSRAPMDLANGRQAWLAGTFDVPEGVERVQVALVLDDWGGYAGLGGSGEIDARGAPIRFEAPVASLARRGRAVVHLDLTRSLVATGAERRLLLPHFGVHY